MLGLYLSLCFFISSLLPNFEDHYLQSYTVDQNYIYDLDARDEPYTKRAREWKDGIL